ncbi:hypothetical protein Syun_023016 [Stephania yunnanensis]|uniref:PEP-utilising enzyme C-terminal domain-containing protein n=1 Tax=Stephania yunnanensis TaxID=152371 RepID=A0AAP0F840_9MAGN
MTETGATRRRERERDERDQRQDRETRKARDLHLSQYATSEQARKVLADLKDGTDTLYMGNICKTWTREQVLERLMNLGVEQIEEIYLPEIMVPLELEHQVSLIRDVSKKLFSEMGTSIGYKIGTMIEIPRAALVADEIAEQVEFFSFGTNDLTQMTFGYSREYVGKFLPIYLSKGILQHDPFETINIFNQNLMAEEDRVPQLPLPLTSSKQQAASSSYGRTKIAAEHMAVTFGAHSAFRRDERMSLGSYLHDRNTWLVTFGAHSSFRWDERMSLGSYLHDRCILTGCCPQMEIQKCFKAAF